MIYTTHVLAAPLVLIVWCIDVYIFMSSVRLILGRLRGAGLAKLRLVLQQFTDGIPQALYVWMSAKAGKPVRAWVPWLIVMVSCLILRHVLIWIVLRVL